MEKQLKLFTIYTIKESNLSKKSKLQLLNWLQKEASVPQLKALILDGRIVSLDEQSEEIVNDRFRASKIRNNVGPILNKVIAEAASKK